MLYQPSDPIVKRHIELMETLEDSRPKGWYRKKVSVWYIDDFIASAVQDFGNSARVFTRYHFIPFNRNDSVIPLSILDHSVPMLKTQLEYCKEKEYDNAFISIENNRVRVLQKAAKWYKKSGVESILLNDKYKTAEDSYQNILLFPIKNTHFNLEKL
jgi:hypothetical protein